MAAAKTYPLSLVLTAVDKVTAVMRKVDKSLAATGKKMTEVGKSATTNLTLPIAGIGAAAVKGFSDFEKGMSSVSTLVDTNTENMAAMGEEVLRIGRDTPVALGDLTAGLYSLRSAGVSAGDQFVHLEKSAQLAVAGLGTTDQAVDLATSAINSWGLEGEAATKVYDQIFKTVKAGKTNIAELAQGFGGVAKTVASSGVPLDEYLSSVAALTTTGQKAAQSHTQLKAVIGGLTRDTKQTRAVFRKLGAKDLEDLIKKSGGLVPALDKISGAIKGNKAKWLELVGSQEAYNAALGLTGSLGDVQRATLDDMRTGAEAMTGGFEKQNKTLTASWQRTKNTLLSAGMTIGQTLAPLLTQLADKIQGIANWFRGLDDSTKGWIIRIAGAVAAIGPLLVVVGKAITVASGLAKAIGFVSTVVRGLMSLLIANPIGAAVALIATAAYLIYDNWEDIRDFFKLLWKEVVKAFEWAWSYIEPIIKKVSKGVELVKLGGGFLKSLVTGEDEPQYAGTIAQGRRSIGLSPPRAAGANNKASIKVDISGAPRGTRAEIDPKSDADVGVAVGYQMGAL